MIPKIIYLQIGDEVDLSFVDFKDLHKDAITWCEDKINVNDIEYINKEYSDQQNKNLLDEIERLKSKINNQNKLLSDLYLATCDFDVSLFYPEKVEDFDLASNKVWIYINENNLQ